METISYNSLLLENKRLKDELNMLKKHGEFKFGPVQSFRRFPDNYHSMSKDKKLECDSEFYFNSLCSDMNHKYYVYYCEILPKDDTLKIETPIIKSKKSGRTNNLDGRIEMFIENSKQIFGDKYGYSEMNYLNRHTKVNIICPIHGSFEKAPKNHLAGQGCPKCTRRGPNIQQQTFSFDIETDNFLLPKENEEGFSPEFTEFLKMLTNK